MDRTPLGSGDLEAWERGLEDGYRFSFGDEEMRDLGPPAVMPIAGRLLVAPSGRLLVNRRDLSSLPQTPRDRIVETWDLVAANGRVEGRFTHDQSVYLRVLTDSMVYAIVRDELDVQYIVGYRIVSDD